MSGNSCPFCEQVNPRDAKFCNACGGALHLVPCPRCGAVSDVSATSCYQCKSPLPGRKREADPAPPAVEAPPPGARPRPAALVAAAAFAVVVAMGYYGYRRSTVVEVPQPAAAGSAGSANAATAEPGETVQAVSPAAAPTEAPLAHGVPAVVSEPRADGEREESQPVNAASGMIARPRAAVPRKADKPAPQRKEVCTQAVAALGLCTMTPEDRKLAEAAAALKAAVAGAEAADPGKAESQAPLGKEPCTEAVEALGLCTRGATQGRE